MNVSAWCIRNPIPAIMFFVMLCFAGILSYQSMKVQNFPDLDVPNIVISASLPGASPAQLEPMWRARSKTPSPRCRA